MSLRPAGYAAVALLMLGAGVALAEDPERSRGLSAHFLPKRVATVDAAKPLRWGFILSTTQTTAVALKDRPVAQSAAGLVAYFKSLDADTRRNGIWVVTTRPDAYSPEEAAVLEDLKRLCARERIALFMAQGKDLPGGWRRF